MKRLKSDKPMRMLYRILLTICLIVLLGFGTLEFIQVAGSTNNWVGSFTLTWGLALFGLVGLFVCGFVWGLLNVWFQEKTRSFNHWVVKAREGLHWLRWPLALVVAFVPTKIFLYTPLGFKFISVGFRLAIFSITAVVLAILSTKEKGKLVNWDGVFVGIVLLGSVFSFSKAMKSVVDHPLSLTWSEGNRIWDYSILFGRNNYNYPGDLPIDAYIDSGRQTLWGLPFLLPDVSIKGVRLWSALVFTVPYAFLGWMSFRYTAKKHGQWILLGFWSFLFLNQGPIYTPLILSAILVVGVHRKPMWLALPLIFLAGHYAQKSRITWMAAAAIWAVLVTLLDIGDLKKGKLSLKNWGTITAFGLAGFFGGFGFIRGWRRIYNLITRAITANAVEATTVTSELAYINPEDPVEAISSFGQDAILSNQPFLLDRLFPNPTYEVGVLLGLLLAAGPVIILLIFLVRSKRWKLNTWQQVGLFGVLFALMVVGLIISTKIGGGGDLHNLDMFLISIILVLGVAWNSVGHDILSDLESQPNGLKLLLLLIVVIPAFMPWTKAKPLELPPEDKTQWTMALLENETSRIVAEGGEILFLDQRQLLTFSYLGDIPLVPEYEKKLVMDRAMSGDRDYFETFYTDIVNQRFALIITDPQRIRFADEDEDWGAENDTWVQWVTQPLLCYYDPVYTIKKTGVWFLMPKENLDDCSPP